MNKWTEILVGLILVIVPIWAIIGLTACASWQVATLAFIKGGIVVFLVMVGLLFLMLGISDLKE